MGLTVLVAESISKTFFGNTVLDAVSLRIEPGTVHALLGHNGSGKSTLIKILSGYHMPDPGGGEISVDGQTLRLGDSASSSALGIRVVHQGLGLIPTLTVIENLRLGSGTYSCSPGWRIRWRDERRRASEALERVGLSGVASEALVGSLTTVEQTGVAIARAMGDDDHQLRCLILDEPTATLPEREVDRLMTLIAGLRERSVSVLYVTHRLDEVPRVAREVTILRDGAVVGAGLVERFTKDDLITLIAGNSHGVAAAHGATAGAPQQANAPVAADERRPPSDAPTRAGLAIEFRSVSTQNLSNLSMTISPGEVVGVVSLVGAGVADIPRLLRGDERYTGEIAIGGVAATLRSPYDANRLGLVVVPSGAAEKIIESLTVCENLTLGFARRFWRHGRLSTRLERSFAAGLIRGHNIRCASMFVPVRVLSGGNKQKVVMARALQLGPRVLVVDEPTNGVDVAGKREILGLIAQAAADGATVIVCSSDLTDVVDICSRVVVLHASGSVTELDGTDIEEATILKEMHVYAS